MLRERLRSVLSAKFIKPVAILLLVIISIVAYELHTSRLQAWYLARLGHQLSFHVEPGSSPSIRYPGIGPYDQRLGYTELPSYLDRLKLRDYTVVEQARLSPRMSQMADRGLYAPYAEKDQAGLSVLDFNGAPIYTTSYPERIYSNFNVLPPLVTNSLLYIENHTLLDPSQPLRNPAVEWGRFAHAAWDRTVYFLKPGYESPGGSTLATQIEKYRHSPEGRTASPMEKMRQMYSASVRAYLNGEDTTQVRRQLVVDYVNTVPLSARAGFGEINGIGDGLWAWYGRDFKEINLLLASNSSAPLAARALAYKEVLSLFISQRSPSYYLARIDELEALTDSYLRLMASAEVITPALRDAALAQSLKQQKEHVRPPPAPPERKGVNAVRLNLATLLGVPRLYDLDRLDITVDSALDAQLQQQVTTELRKLRDPAYAKKAGLIDFQLLQHGDPHGVTYSFTLFERTPGGNRVRVQTDNFDQPFDINKGVKLDLGSTAKLRTLITYLEIVADLHRLYVDLQPKALKKVNVAPHDPIKHWALQYLVDATDRSLPTMLEAALDREYSGNPGEQFFTGGGVQSFENFEKYENDRTYTVREGLRYSVNLVYVRLMRDIVHFYMYQVPGSSAHLLGDDDDNDAQRGEYLKRFADREGRVFIAQFYRKYHGMSDPDEEETLAQGIHPTPKRLAVIFRSIAPDASPAQFAKFVNTYSHSADLDADELTKLYDKYSPQRFGLADRGYLAGVHPLELWVAGYLRQHPKATFSQTVEASSTERQEVYKWLFKTRHKNAQDKRIKQLLEVEGFQGIHRAWKRLGYPFDSLVPSYGTAIGASADRPDALAELMGIIMNDGVRLPTVRIDNVHFAVNTPFETVLTRTPAAGEPVLLPEITSLIKPILAEVVQLGTAKRLAGVFALPDGTQIPVGGKTGTGDNRFKIFAKGGGLVSERVVSRSGAFVFYIGDRYFGTVVAYVAGPKAAEYKFTSALTVQILKVLAPTLMHRFNEIAAGPSPNELRYLNTALQQGKQKAELATTPTSVNFKSILATELACPASVTQIGANWPNHKSADNPDVQWEILAGLHIDLCLPTLMQLAQFSPRISP
ncbi:transglycosylase domain-containing protein [Solimicrobium silvestre]|uniref:peptidoglycan glycosyltransferase n=1 Tax=Solimicrobium silvestre TaxID=2099400 RepID=A0A2S9GWD7_9BURK|nr:transglycosylase domain-containing protein [Solimicrobium silvestre]PRC92039.1 Transglycosylase [Solimicrobium silvestre]